MVVLLVLALAAGAVVLTAVPANPVTSDAARFAGRVAAARDFAVTGNRPVSVWVRRSGYGFDLWRAGAWTPVQERSLATRRWPDGTAAAASGIAGRAATVGDGTARVTFDNLGMPDSPASIAIARDGRRAIVAIDADGSIDLQ